ncbi:hypothetical protein [Jeotgalibacillus campisalis]|uniref:Uncharacterized protein n=1 Tax=Jeotgalibacillus campisalis TaxID=220754 RepID=A0A0C2VPF4_9BACL|nr:hypothetical protein [Jeotgalibacillus campisalis]KIL45893.1 hypothetical protein KR50_25680 [Jeotgalibacillus campisalis]
MRKKLIFICLISLLVIVSTFYFLNQLNNNATAQQQLTSSKEVEEIQLKMEQMNKSKVFNQITDKLTANNYKILGSTAIQYNVENGWVFIIDIPKVNRDATKEEEIKTISKEVLDKSELSKYNFSVKVLPKNIQN